MNTPPRLLNSSMSLASMCAVSVAANGEASSSSFCMPGSSLSPMPCSHNYSALGDLSLSTSSLDVTLPFITTAALTSHVTSGLPSTSSANAQPGSLGLKIPSSQSSSNNSLLSSPIPSMSPRLLDSSSLMNHDIFASPLRTAANHINQPNFSQNSHNLLLQTPTHSLLEAPLILSHSRSRFSPSGPSGTSRNASLSPFPSDLLSISPSGSNCSTNMVATMLTQHHLGHEDVAMQSSENPTFFQREAQSNYKSPKKPVILIQDSKSSRVNSGVSASNSTAVYTVPSDSGDQKNNLAQSSSSVLSSILQQHKSPPQNVQLSKPGPTPQKIAPKKYLPKPQKSTPVSKTVRQQSFTPFVGAQQQPTAVQGLLIQVPSAPGQPPSNPVLLVPQPSVVQPQPLLIVAPSGQGHHQSTFAIDSSAVNMHDSSYLIQRNYATNIVTAYVPQQEQQQIMFVEETPPFLSNQIETTIPQTIEINLETPKKMPSPRPVRVDPSSSASKINPMVTSSRNLDDEDIPTKPINLENLNCARSLVVFPPTLPAFTESAKQNFDNFMSVSRLSLLASPTGGTNTPTLIGGVSGPSSPNSNLLSLSPTLTTDHPVSIPDLTGSLPGLTTAKLAQSLRLVDAVHLAPDTVINGIHVGNLLESVRRCRERRIRFGIAQQEVSNNLVPIHGESFRQASICKLENLSLKLETANKMVAVLQPYYDSREREFIQRLDASSSTQSIPKPHPRTKFFSRHSQRHSFNDEARELLRSVFAADPYPSKKTITSIAETLNVPQSVVRVWFSNRRLEQNKRLKSHHTTTGTPAMEIISTRPPIFARQQTISTSSSSTNSSKTAEKAKAKKQLSSSTQAANFDQDEIAMMDHSGPIEPGPSITNMGANDSNNNSDLFFLEHPSATGLSSFFGT